jgi:hypothetical protein
MRRFGKSLRQDIDAVRHAMTEPWSNGQAEGQINRLKTLKRVIYGRASVALLRARMLPLQQPHSYEFEEDPVKRSIVVPFSINVQPVSRSRTRKPAEIYHY